MHRNWGERGGRITLPVFRCSPLSCRVYNVHTLEKIEYVIKIQGYWYLPGKQLKFICDLQLVTRKISSNSDWIKIDLMKVCTLGCNTVWISLHSWGIHTQCKFCEEAVNMSSKAVRGMGCCHFEIEVMLQRWSCKENGKKPLWNAMKTLPSRE